LYVTDVRGRAVHELGVEVVFKTFPSSLVPPASDGRSAFFWGGQEIDTTGAWLGIVRYDGRRRTKVVRSVPKLRALAAGAGRFAYAIDGRIVVASRTGRSSATYIPSGRVTALAVTDGLVAALVHSRGWRLEVYEPRHRLLRLGGRPGVRLAGENTTLALSIGKSVYALDAVRMRLGLVARARAAPIGLSLANGRIAWAEEIRGGTQLRETNA
jgi:hypothetical protein